MKCNDVCYAEDNKKQHFQLKKKNQMQIGEVIREYRKSKNMTQEDMTNRFGVTGAAVNKWENENSFPDITLLAPIDRLLGISLDTLLSFQDELTSERINRIVLELDGKLKEEEYKEVFHWAKGILECYVRALESEEEYIRCSAADSLFGFYSRKGQYDKAEEYLTCFSKQNPERKRKQAFIYSKTNRVEKAIRHMKNPYFQVIR